MERILETSISNFKNSRLMTKIEAFNLEFYCCCVPIWPHRSQVYKTRVLKSKTESSKLDFFGIWRTFWLEICSTEEDDLVLGGRSSWRRTLVDDLVFSNEEKRTDARKKRRTLTNRGMIWRRVGEQRKNAEALIGREEEEERWVRSAHARYSEECKEEEVKLKS